MDVCLWFIRVQGNISGFDIVATFNYFSWHDLHLQTEVLNCTNGSNVLLFSKLYDRLKVSEPNSVSYLHGAPIFGWCVIRCGCKNEHQTRIICIKKFALHAQNSFTILSLIFNIFFKIFFEGGWWPILSFYKKENFIFFNLMSSKIPEGNGYSLNFDLLIILHQLWV
jgi:hypothetical protein